MGDISKLNVGGTLYDIKDAKARTDVSDLKEDLFFLADTQEKLFLSTSINTMEYKDTSVAIPAGTYKMTADSFVTSDTDVSVCRVFFQNNGADILVIDVARNVAIDRAITLNSAIDRVRIYAGTNYSNSVGDTLVVSNLILSHDSVLNERITANEEGINRLIRREPFEINNIFSLTGATEGKYVDKNGDEYSNSNVGHTDYLDISAYVGKLTLSLLADPLGNIVIYQGAFYDDDKTFISGYIVENVTADREYLITPPNNAKYMIFDYILRCKDDYYILATTKNSISYDFVDNFSGVSKNVFTTDGAINNYYVSQDGNVVATDGVSATDYIDISFADKILMYMPQDMTHQGAFFDKNKKYVSGYYRSGSYRAGEWYEDVPESACYIRISYITNAASSYYANAIVGDYADFGDRVIRKASAYNLKMNCLGDSITYGYIPDSGAQMARPYPTILKDLLGLAECRNYGISGSTLAINSGNYQPMCVRYADMNSDADIVLVFGGTNDYGRAVYTESLGTISSSDTSTVYGALNTLCDGLITKFPKALIFLCTPLKRADKTGANGAGYTLEDVADAIRNVGHKFGMPVLDLNYDGGFYIAWSAFRAQYGGNDRLHPNQAFDEEHLAPMIASFIKSKM